MPKLGLRPYATIEEGVGEYLGYNFTRLENVFERMADVIVGTTTVTGSATVNTGLAVVDGVVCGFATDPVAGACFISAAPGSAGTITIRVLTSAFALSVTAISIRWVAIGELVLS